ncbi:MAG TPA: 50S ribosomal protein L19e [Candidatus Thermoplasmatota archaeon]|nr:50S ribosomal protein L19e [Candidatus Thermoplasmatota archaeon]
MADLRNQRRLAAAVLKVGASRVRIDPDRGDEVAGAVTRADVRKLVSGGVIFSVQKIGVSRGRARKIAAQKKKGRRTGPGSRKGARYARKPRKDRWISTIRALRDELRTLREKEAIDAHAYRAYYVRAKGGQFRSRAHMRSHMKTEGALKEEVAL